MQMSQMHYLPIAPVFFAILVGAFFIVLILRSVSYAYESLGVSHHAAMWLLFAFTHWQFFQHPDRGAAAGAGDVQSSRRFLRHAL